MSTSETVEYEIGACPCGKGHLIRSVTTQDNPWSGADSYIYVGCDVCRHEWRVDGRSLVNVPSEAAYKAAYGAERSRYDEVMAIVNPLVDRYFESLAAKSKKAEHDAMTQLGIATGSYRNYLEDRRKSKPYSASCYGLRNPEWMTTLADQVGLRAQLDEATSLLTEAKARLHSASLEIIRRPMPQS